jgi:hypothetical protein
MERLTTVIIALCMCCGVMFSGCSTSDSTEPPVATGLQAKTPDYPEESSTREIIKVLSDQGFTKIINEVTINSDTGFLAENISGKKCFVLKGKPYSMGYQMGALDPEGTYKMAVNYTDIILSDTLESEPDSSLYKLAKDMAVTLAKEAVTDKAIPDYLLEEMQGMADGATKVGGKQVTFDDVLLLNEGYDALYSMVLTLQLPLIKIVQKELMGCNGFILSGDATAGGKVLHGRDFMFSTADIYQKVTAMGIYLPEKGYPFVTLAAPGMVGLTTGLNSKGLSMGCDVVMGGATRNTPGLGCLLVIRDIIQNSTNLDNAVERMKQQNRGVTWIYVLADNERSARYTNGVVIEQGMSFNKWGNEFDSIDDLTLDVRIKYAGQVAKLPAEYPERGLLIRTQDWEFPEAFLNEDMFPKQDEVNPDVVIATNHYIHPFMTLTTFEPWINMLQTGYWKGTKTLQRYSDLNKRILDAINQHRVDFETARDLIDFMNPLRYVDLKEREDIIKKGYVPWDRFEVDEPIEGHHDIFDNQELIMECLYGYYRAEEPWVRIDLKPFAALSDIKAR